WVASGRPKCEVERGVVHCCPEVLVRRRGDEVYVSTADAPTVGLVAQINPAARGVGSKGSLVLHLADAAKGDRHPLRVLVQKQTVEHVNVGDHAPQVLLRVGAGKRCGGDLEVESSPYCGPADEQGDRF